MEIIKAGGDIKQLPVRTKAVGLCSTQRLQQFEWRMMAACMCTDATEKGLEPFFFAIFVYCSGNNGIIYGVYIWWRAKCFIWYRLHWIKWDYSALAEVCTLSAFLVLSVYFPCNASSLSPFSSSVFAFLICFYAFIYSYWLCCVILFQLLCKLS